MKRYKGGGGPEPTLLFVMGRGFECKRYGRFDHYYPMDFWPTLAKISKFLPFFDQIL